MPLIYLIFHVFIQPAYLTYNDVISLLLTGHQLVSGSCALCQLQDHVSRVLSTSGGSVRPAPIIQHLKSERLIEPSL